MNAQNPLCEKMIRYVHQHYNEPLTLERLSSIFYMNKAYLGRVFAKSTGQSFNEYLRAYRIKVAMQMLSRRNLSVMEVSKAVGYQNLNYFFRVFKAHAGVTPSGFRAAARRYVLQSQFQPHSSYLTETFRGQQVIREGVIALDMDLGPGDAPGNFVEVKPGVLRYYYFSAPAGKACLRFVGSMDDGITWTEQGQAFEAEALASSPGLSMLLMMDGSLGAFYAQGGEDRQGVLMHRRSYDDGLNWTEPAICLKLDGHELLEGRMCRLEGGPLVLPAALPALPMVATPQQRQICHFISQDDGEHWHLSPAKPAINSRHSALGFVSPMVLERSGGRLRGYAATDLGCLYTLESEDEGESWSSPQPSILTSAPTPMHVIRLQDSHLMAACNPVPDYNTSRQAANRCGRARLIYCVSKDDGKSWGKSVIIENSADEDESYCRPLLYKGMETVCAAYFVTRATSHEPTLRIRRFLLRSLMEGV